jgi:hypothetical protein
MGVADISDIQEASRMDDVGKLQGIYKKSQKLGPKRFGAISSTTQNGGTQLQEYSSFNNGLHSRALA